MKLRNYFCLFVAVMMAACGSDSNDPLDPDNNEEPATLNSQAAFDGLDIDGASVVNGAPPAPNAQISLDIPASTVLGVQDEGFNIPFSTDGNAIGAYLQVTSDEGGLVDQYYDINLNSNKSIRPSLPLTGNEKMDALIRKSRKQNENEDSLEIDLANSFPVGEFCVILCIYDGEGNISAPVQVCVTVESWGGPTAIQGDWDVTKYTYTVDGEEFDLFLFGDTICEGGFCFTWLESLSLNPDGTYVSTLDYSYTAEGQTEAFTYTFEGNWSYNSSIRQLVLVSYFLEYIFNSSEGNFSDSFTYPIGEGYTEIYDNVQLSGSELRMRYFDGTEDGDVSGSPDLDNTIFKVYRKN